MGINFESELNVLLYDQDEARGFIKEANETLAEVEPKIDNLLADLRATAENCADRVLKGVEFLNTNVRGWAKQEKINVSDLDLSDTSSCVLGQLAAKSAIRSAGYSFDNNWNGFYDFNDAVRAFQQKHGSFSAEAAGFDADGEAMVGVLADAEDWVTVTYDILNHMWNAVILRQRSKKKVEKKHLLKAVGV